MRIITGIARGMTLAVPRGDKIRPTSDRTREAIFSSLADRVTDAAVLDLFAGTGALGLEAASRGAKSVTFVEQNKSVLDCLRQNVELAQSYSEMRCDLTIVGHDVFRELRGLTGPYNIILADPPYGELPQEFLDELALPKLLAIDGLLVLELGRRDQLEVGANWEVMRDANYGDTRVLFLKSLLQ